MKQKLCYDAFCAALEKLPDKSGCASIRSCPPLERQILRPARNGADIDWAGLDITGIRLSDIDLLEESISDVLSSIRGSRKIYNKLARQNCSAGTERGFC